jgi:hypothetical protein
VPAQRAALQRAVAPSMAGGRRARAASCLLAAAAAAAALSGAAAEPSTPSDVPVLDMIPTWWTVRASGARAPVARWQHARARERWR